MRYKIYIDYDGSGYKECFPDTVNPFKLVKVNVSTTDIEQFFYRFNWGVVQFSNKPLQYSKTSLNIHKLYNIINDIDFSTKILIKQITTKKTIYGYFGRNDCDFDHDKKSFTVSPAIVDSYTPILESWENEIDFTNYPFDKTLVKVKIEGDNQKTIMDWPTKEATSTETGLTWTRNRVKETDYDNEGLLTYFDGQKPKQTLFGDSYWGFMNIHNVYDNQDLPIGFYPSADNFLSDRVSILGKSCSNTIGDENYGPDLDMHYGDYELSQFRVYEGSRIGGLSGKRWRQLYCQTWFTREENTKIDEVDDSSSFGFKSPVGDGWSMRKSTIKDGKTAHVWTRKPFNGAYSEAWELQPEVLNSGTNSEYDFNWNKYRESKLKYDDSQNSFELISTIKLKDFIEYLLHKSDSTLENINFKSTFFFNDFEETVPYLTNTTGVNYVTSSKNYLNNLRLFFTRDLIPSEDGKVKKIPKFTLKSILNELNNLFVNTLIWFVDINGNLRIEHKKFGDLLGNRLDIRNKSSLFFTSQYSFDKSIMFERYEFNQTNAGYADFSDNVVLFNRLVSNNRNKDDKFEAFTRYITTDAKYCILNPSGLSDGAVLLCLDSNNVCLNKVGDISGLMETNGYLALSNILNDFGTYEGITNNGTINGKPKKFQTTPYGKLGIELILDGTLDSLFYVTQLGYGLITNGEVDFENEYTKVTLRYRFNSNSIVTSALPIAFKQNVIANVGNFTLN